MFNNQNDDINDLEKVIVSVLRKQGVLNNYHEFGVVVKQLNNTTLLVDFPQFDNPPEEIPCAQMERRYVPGDRVLVEYINGSAHQKFVIAVLQKGYEQSKIDYSQLKDTPVRVFREDAVFTGDSHGIVIDDDIEEPPVRLAWKLLYDEGSDMEWWEILHRDSSNKLISITTYWPPNGGFVFTNYIVRDEDGFFKYYGPNATA